MNKNTWIIRYRLAGVILLLSVVLSGVMVSLTSRLDVVRGTSSCPTVNITPNISYAYGYVTLNGQNAPIGTIVEARNQSGITTGCIPVDTAGIFASMPIYGTDTTVTPNIPGMGNNEVVNFYVNGVAASSSPTLTWTNDRSSHLVTLSATAVSATATPTITPTATTQATATSIPTSTPLPTSTPFAVPTNTVAPLILFTPPGSAVAGAPLMISAIVTDDVAVQSVTLFFRRRGASTFISQTMTLSAGSLYSTTIGGSNVLTPSLDYYIMASDGVYSSWSGSPATPYQINVIDRPGIVFVYPGQGSPSGGYIITITGSNFKPGASAMFSGINATNVTVVSSTLITCIAPPHYPSRVDVTVMNPDGQSGTFLNRFMYLGTGAQISVPSGSGLPHTIVQIPINISIAGMVAGDLGLAFDSNVIQPIAVHPGSLNSTWTIVANTSMTNQVYFSMASPAGAISGTGSIAVIDFNVTGTAGVTTALHINGQYLNDGTIMVQASDGVFTVQSPYTISGTVKYWNNNASITNTLLTMTGARGYTGTSDSTGSYTMTGVYPGSYSLVPAKADGANGITAFDASLALQYATGLISLQGYARTAADVNGDGSVSSMDAYLILQRAASLINLPFSGAGSIWIFNPTGYNYSNLSGNLSGQNFTGVLVGDVSGNWNAGGIGLAPQQQPQASASIYVKTSLMDHSGLITATICVTATSVPIPSLDLELKYSSAAATALTIQANPQLTQFMSSLNIEQPGVIRVAMASATAITGGNDFITIVFRVTKPGSQLVITRGDIAEGAVSTTLETGYLGNHLTYMPVIWRNQ